jgi:pyruvate, orthophosphate dikinase
MSAGKTQPPPLLYRFGANTAEAGLGLRDAVGGRGAYLCELAEIGLPTPPGFVVTAEACRSLASGKMAPALKSAIAETLVAISAETGKTFGDPANPFFLAVRPSAANGASGVMEAVLNIGLNDKLVETLAKSTNEPRFAHECYRRLIQNYAHVVLGDDPSAFDDIIHLYRDERNLVSDSEFTTQDARELITRFKAQVKSTGEPFPQDVMTQLHAAIAAMVKAWAAPRAKAQRKLHNVPETSGIAVTVQVMVFGNRAENSGAGIAALRSEATGETGLHGIHMPSAQGPDLLAKIAPALPVAQLHEQYPRHAEELQHALETAERHFRDAMELDFTMEAGKLWFLDARPAPRSTRAALKLAVELANASVITRDEALLRIDPMSLVQMLHATIDPTAKKHIVATGLAASPGAATGVIVFGIEEARRRSAAGESVILVRPETLPEDIRALHVAEGVLTTRGGMTSHAAVIARGMGKPCVSGAGSLRIDLGEETLSSPQLTLQKGEIITIDGSTGQILRGAVPTLKPSVSGDFATLLSWADAARRMKVRANAETPQEVKIARDYGAEGIGLCRTEHMFFEGDRIIAMREMILADREKDRRAALDKILPVMRADFVELFEIMAGKPVTVRLLDPPLHEFLPEGGADLEEVAKALGTGVTTLRRRVVELSEQNPMLGHRGVRLLLSYPEITDMQARAIFEAAAVVEKSLGTAPLLEIMVPLVVSRQELDLVKQRIVAVAAEVEREQGVRIAYLVGTMIELPRAALQAGEIAKSAEFFSFGTNDLTQTAFGISRDDSARFIGEYTSKGIFSRDPFVTLDIEGVGELIAFAVQRGRKTRKDISLGICGEHGGDPDSIAFCEEKGLDYVSCSPFRVPIARLAAAQAGIRKKRIKLNA